MKWYTRMMLRSMLPQLPFQQPLRAFKRRISAYNAKNAADVLEYALLLFERLPVDGWNLKDKTALELGTGWEPLIPLLLRCAGCKKVMTVDLHRLLDITSCRRTLAFLRENVLRFSRRIGSTRNECEAFLDTIETVSLPRFLETAGLDYRSPCDARNLPFSDGSIDLITSNNVLEHIPPGIISGIFHELYRVLTDTGKMAHTIDNVDHWSYTDPSISRVNFLQYEDSFWQRTEKNPIDYQNRLRHNDYVKFFADAGFKIVTDISEVDRQILTDLGTIPLSSRFRDIPHETLAVSLSRIIAEKESG